MTSRERVRSAITHQETDRVPLDLGGMRSTSIMATAYSRLTDYLGIADSETFVYDVVHSLAQPEDAILERFGIDVVDLGRTFFTEPEARKPFARKAMSTISRRDSTGGFPFRCSANRQTVTENNGDVTTWTYDNANQLSVRQRSGGECCRDR